MSNYEKRGLPEDLLTNKIEGERKVKVSSLSDSDTNSIIAALLSQISSSNNDIRDQLKLLNARFEEAFNTRLEGEDIE